MSDFLTVNEDDDEALKNIKKVAKDAIDSGDTETIAYLKLRAAISLVGSLIEELSLPEDNTKADLLDDFLRSAIQSYRDTVILVNIKGLNESVYKDDSGETIKGFLNIGDSLLRSKITSNEALQEDIGNRMVKTFPSLTASIEKNEK